MKEIEKLITDNLGLVRHIAKSIEAPNVEYEDLVSEGTIGLIKAARTFDESKNIKFSTYSGRCITNQMMMYLRKEKKYATLRSIDEILYEDNQGSKLILADLIADEKNYYEESDNNEILENIINWIINLEDAKARTILLLKGAGIKQKEIGDKLSLSQSYISRIENKTKQKLKKCVDGRKIYNRKYNFVKKGGFYIITFYKKNIKFDVKTFNKVNQERQKISLTYFDVKQLDKDEFEIILMEEDNSMIFLANLLNQIA